MNKIINTSLFLITILLSVIVAEILFRFYLDVSMIYGMEMHKYAKKLKRKSKINGLTHEHIPGTKAHLMGVDIKINNFGIRDKFLPNPKQKDEKRILVVGSSITMGWGVEYDSVFTTKLEQAFETDNLANKYEIINAGIGNYNTPMEVIYTKNILLDVNPDVIILHFFLNDVEEISPNNSIILKNSYIAAQLYLKYKQSKFAQSNKFKNLGDYYLDMFKNHHQGRIEAQKAILSLSDICNLNGIEFFVLMQPDLNDLSYDSGQFKCHKIMRQFLNANNIKFLDLFDNFSSAVGDNPKKIWIQDDDSHPNAAGHNIIFKSLYDYMARYN